jgi:hypothetical protein
MAGILNAQIKKNWEEAIAQFPIIAIKKKNFLYRLTKVNKLIA